VSLICVVCAKGAPGTTTTAMLLAALWPRDSVLVDADPMGGDIGLRLPSASGAPLRTDGGLLRLLPAARRGLTADVVLGHCQEAQGGQSVITGLEGPEQASAVSGLWDELGQAFAALPDRDVIADAGQAHTSASTLPLLRRATAVVFVVQPTLTGVVHTRQRVAALLPELAGPDGHTPLLGFVVVETSKTRAADSETTAAEIEGALESLRFFGTVAHDRASVRMFEGSPQRHPERSLLARSGAAVVSALTEILPVEQTPVDPTPAGGPHRAPSAPPGTPPPDRSLADLWLSENDSPPGMTGRPPAEHQPTAPLPASPGQHPTTRREARDGRRWQRKRGRS